MLVGRQGDYEAFSEALRGIVPPNAEVLTAGVFDVKDVEFVGIESPDAARVNLRAPEPIDGEAEGWLYFEPFAAYTEHLVALRLA